MSILRLESMARAFTWKVELIGSLAKHLNFQFAKRSAKNEESASTERLVTLFVSTDLIVSPLFVADIRQKSSNDDCDKSLDFRCESLAIDACAFSYPQATRRKS